MSELSIFHYESADVRVIRDEQGEPWWVAKDVAEALGYAEGSNPSRLFANVPDEWKGVKPIHTPSSYIEMVVLSEQGLYFFLGRSDKMAALPMQKWIAGEVLPSIRKTGTYSVSLPKTLPEALRAYAAEIELRQEAEKQLAIAAPKVEFFDAVAGSEDAIEIGRLAKVLNVGIGRNKLFEFMRNKHLLMNNNVPYQTTIDAGYFRVVEQKYNKPDGTVNLTTKTLARPKGQVHIRKLLIGSGYVPKTATGQMVVNQ